MCEHIMCLCGSWGSPDFCQTHHICKLYLNFHAWIMSTREKDVI
jgi:hypothetical protein